MNKIHARRLLKLCALLETDYVSKHFNFSRWVGDDFKGRANLSCGTSACALGWATTMPELRDKRRVGLRLKGGDVVLADPSVVTESGEYNDYKLAAKIAFGLDRKGSEACFIPHQSRGDDGFGYGPKPLFPGDRIPRNDATPHEVAQQIRRYVAWATSDAGKAAGA